MPIAEQVVETSYYLRPADAADEDFLVELYAQERRAELMRAGLDTSQREAFLRMQFRARKSSYATNHPTASSEIVCMADGSAVGRLLISRTGDEARLVDIALDEGKRRRGLGTKLIQQLQQECRTLGREMKLQVLKESEAVRLYRRLGFEVEGEDLIRCQMVWNRTRG
jgi:ribosomal protein S18 acetylase RimI-like enzyme